MLDIPYTAKLAFIFAFEFRILIIQVLCFDLNYQVLLLRRHLLLLHLTHLSWLPMMSFYIIKTYFFLMIKLIMFYLILKLILGFIYYFHEEFIVELR